ncbi:type II toxin-antitoxin system VapC family toxin [Actinomycetospora termitidis]|uniref:Ribonuclease VapC n=1 Tax=Actinomycetospora termitidis TaxID=3053470 RepID=A0ABT7M8K5_9PSEU|nr:type II toxin-antitoxin system VapC family toxin [Actinomycetospora sp. Odt1-22]MDL5156982.1 type II toxin-antitoxin system VapC family toxin [Actinomycetospora sp. Odt1-22]
MIVVDTNVLSDLTKPNRSDGLESWFATEPEVVVVSAVTLAEIDMGIAIMPAGARREMTAFAMRAIVDDSLEGVVIPFDRAAAEQYGPVVAARRAAGRPISIADAQIAAICRARGATLATRNVRDFEHTGITVFDPSS